MALISPGVEVTVIDEANYAPNQLGTIPLILLATAENKTTPSGAIAQGTIKANAGKLVAATSQRELLTLFGSPLFYQTSGGTPLHGYELNEYGLMASYSALGVTNRVYAIRADVDLAQLGGTSVRPTGTPPNNTYWLNLAYTKWGIFEWDSGTQKFVEQTPIVIDDTANVSAGAPKQSLGSIGSYAVVATDTNNPIYFKKYDNTWVRVGSDDWVAANPTITGGTGPVTAGFSISINSVTVAFTGTTVSSVATDINNASITGVTARVSGSGNLEIYSGSTVVINNVSYTGGTTPLQQLGISIGSYYTPRFVMGPHTSVPQWKTGDNQPRPSGSLWVKTTSANNGASFDLSVYSALSNIFTAVSAPLYANDQSANKALDSSGGGKNIAAGTIYVEYDYGNYLGDSVSQALQPTFKIFKRQSTGPMVVTGSVADPIFANGDQFTIRTSSAGSNEMSGAYTVTLTQTTPAGFVTAVQAANIPNLEVQVTSTNQIAITHTQGGLFILTDGTGGPLNKAGITTSLSNVRQATSGVLIASNWIPLTYTASIARPSSDPDDGTLWYYSDVSDVDIMIHNGSAWRGYKTITTDARGYNLTQTDPTGIIISASQPDEQSDGDPLVSGDLWLDTSDLENYPVIRRYDATSASWTLIDNSDQTTENGILFADARWDSDGTKDPIVDEMVTTASLLTSNYTDLDAPDPALYPRGMLLFNTRRSGYNVKKFRKNYFNANDFVGSLPTEKNTWVNATGNKDNGSPWMGRKAQRQVVVDAMRAAIDGNTEIREEQQVFNLIAAPGYHELIPNMITLKNDRKDTAFIIGDTPFRLAPNAIDIANFNNNVNGEGLAVNDAYCALFYPSGITNDLTGNSIVVPPSHIALRTMIRSDNISFPWFAPAGTQRGLVDNALQLGYVDSDSGEFVYTGLTPGIRDTLYENKINPITFLPGVGIVIYGQKTRDPNSPSALDRINVARLAVYIRVNMNLLAKPFVFEPNDKLTRDQMKQVIEQMLNDLVAKRALQDYVVVCDETNNTPTRIDRNELYADVAIIPVKAAEFIYIPIRIRNTGSL